MKGWFCFYCDWSVSPPPAAAKKAAAAAAAFCFYCF